MNPSLFLLTWWNNKYLEVMFFYVDVKHELIVYRAVKYNIAIWRSTVLYV